MAAYSRWLFIKLWLNTSQIWLRVKFQNFIAKDLMFYCLLKRSLHCHCSTAEHFSGLVAKYLPHVDAAVGMVHFCSSEWIYVVFVYRTVLKSLWILACNCNKHWNTCFRLLLLCLIHTAALAQLLEQDPGCQFNSQTMHKT